MKIAMKELKFTMMVITSLIVMVLIVFIEAEISSRQLTTNEQKLIDLIDIEKDNIVSIDNKYLHLHEYEKWNSETRWNAAVVQSIVDDKNKFVFTHYCGVERGKNARVGMLNCRWIKFNDWESAEYQWNEIQVWNDGKILRFRLDDQDNTMYLKLQNKFYSMWRTANKVVAIEKEKQSEAIKQAILNNYNNEQNEKLEQFFHK
jgi:hypothetical protein